MEEQQQRDTFYQSDDEEYDEETTASGLPRSYVNEGETDSIASIAATENELLVQVRSGLYVILAVIGLLVATGLAISQRHQGYRHLKEAFEELIPKSDFPDRRAAMAILADELALLPDWPAESWRLLPSHLPTTLSEALFVLPVVSDAARAEYETYTLEHENDWFHSSATVATERRTLLSNEIASHIFNENGTVPAGQTTLPLWQTAPLSLKGVEQWVNFDALSSKLPINHVMHSKEIALSSPLFPTKENSSLLETIFSGSPSSSSTTSGPLECIVYPITSPNNASTVLAILVSVLEWNFPDQLDVVVENTCGQNVSYTVGSDKNRQFAGVVSAERKEPIQATVPFATTSYCSYSITLFPSSSMKEQYVNWSPLVYAIAAGAVIALIGFIFSCYDELVEERQKVVMEHATQADTILASLFPQQVRERLFRRNSENAPSVRSEGEADGAAPIVGSIEGGIQPVSSHRIKTFLSNDTQFIKNTDAERPIADLFPHCT